MISCTTSTGTMAVVLSHHKFTLTDEELRLPRPSANTYGFLLQKKQAQELKKPEVKR